MINECKIIDESYMNKRMGAMGWIKCVALRVVDGDTLKVKVVDNFNCKDFYTAQSFRLRLAGVDAPELKLDTSEVNNNLNEQNSMPLAKEARAFVCNFIKFNDCLDEGAKCHKSAVFDLFAIKRDQYDRVLGFVFVNGVMLNLHLLYEGLAELYEGPDAQYCTYEKYLKIGLDIGKLFGKGIHGLKTRETTVEYKRRMKKDSLDC